MGLVIHNETKDKVYHLVKEFNLLEDAVNLDIVDVENGVPSISVTLVTKNSMDFGYVVGDLLKITHSDFGVVTGNVTGVSFDKLTASLEIDTTLSGLINKATIPSMLFEANEENLKTIIETFFKYSSASIPKITIKNFDIFVLDKLSVAGFSNEVAWKHLKKFLSANRIDISLLKDEIILSQANNEYVNLKRIETWQYSMDTISADDNNKLYSIVIYHKKSIKGTDRIYPPRPVKYPFSRVKPISLENLPIISCDANKSNKVIITLDCEVTELTEKIVCAYEVPESAIKNNDLGAYKYTGLYVVTGKDNLPIKPAQWLENGGDLSLRLMPDRKSIEVTVYGADIKNLAPFKICESTGDKDYNSLYIVGKGFQIDVETIDLFTPEKDSLSFDSDIGDIEFIDNPSIENIKDALFASQITLDNKQGNAKNLHLTVTSGHKDKQIIGELIGKRFKFLENFWRINKISLGSGNTIDIESNSVNLLKDLPEPITFIDKQPRQTLEKLSIYPLKDWNNYGL